MLCFCLRRRRAKQPANPSARGHVVGIDLGTAFSRVAVYQRGKVRVFRHEAGGDRFAPSVVALLDGNLAFVGEPAVALPTDSQIFGVKRIIGRSWTDPTIQWDKRLWPFIVVEKDRMPMISITVNGKPELFTPEEITAMVVRYLKKIAESALREQVTQAVVTVPAYFNERQRHATKLACEIAGLEVVEILNESTAAAIAFGIADEWMAARRTVLVFDLGAGTFDATVLTIEGSEFAVLAHAGDTHLGGQDFDERLMQHCFEEFHRCYGVNVSANQRLVLEVRRNCELAKKTLSQSGEAVVYVFHKLDAARVNVTRARFEHLCDDLFQRTVALAEQALQDAQVSWQALDAVLLVGGSTRMPRVHALLRAALGDGQGDNDSQDDGDADDVDAVPQLRYINTDEAVASGAALRAAALAGPPQTSGRLGLREVTALSLGLGLADGRFDVVIPKHTPVPCERTKRYRTTEDYQGVIASKVYQGVRSHARDNHSLAKELRLPVPLLPRGEAALDVTFRVNKDSLVGARAMEPREGAWVVSSSTGSGGGGQQEVRPAEVRMAARVARFRLQDRKELQKILGSR